MREFKFRAFHESVGMWYIDDLYWFEEQGVHEMDDSYYKFMQFIGLKDKNGKEIYEGDICEGHSDGNGEIVFAGYYDCGYDYQFKDGNSVGIEEVRKDIRVIGNIYQNPELL